jgi:Na+-transporting NADH:ubiquinone oxidoreductase subunit F
MTASLPSAALDAFAGVIVFVAVVMVLVMLVLLARRLLVPRGTVRLVVNGRDIGRVPRERKLLAALIDGGLFIPSACGGTGTCGLCRVQVVRGGSDPHPMETARLTKTELASGLRLACQVALRDDVEVELPDDLFGVRELVCTVRSNRSVATFMKELVLELPADERLEFRAGAFVQLTAPPFEASFRDFDVPADMREEWDRLGLWRLGVRSTEPVVRAYSLANHPGEEGVLVLIVRIATPPPDAGPDVPPGVVSSYVFSRRPGDSVHVTGPFGSFVARDTDREMVFVGGGAGMAPMRSHVLDQLERRGTDRTISFWYGARSLRELFYADLFDRLARKHANFSWHVALSEPRPEDAWEGPVGFVHKVLEQDLLREHPCPEECEYYLCGPPLMIAATRALLAEYGVPDEHVLSDDFGGG